VSGRFTLRPPYSHGKNPDTHWVAPRSWSGRLAEKNNLSALLNIETRIVRAAACSKCMLSPGCYHIWLSILRIQNDCRSTNSKTFKPCCHFMYRQVQNLKFYVLPAECICVLRWGPTTASSEMFPQPSLSVYYAVRAVSLTITQVHLLETPSFFISSASSIFIS
jgi:hypothetical protein